MLTMTGVAFNPLGTPLNHGDYNMFQHRPAFRAVRIALATYFEFDRHFGPFLVVSVILP